MMRAFTLIETIIYMALLSVIIACSFAALGSAGGMAASALSAADAATEGSFAAAKAAYVLGRDSGAVLTLRDTTLVLTQDGETLPLTSANVSVSSLAVTPIADDGTQIGREVSFRIRGILFSAEAYDAP